MGKGPRVLTFSDIPGCVAYLAFRGIPATYRADEYGKIVADVEATPAALEAVADFQANPTVQLEPFLRAQRRERGKMIDAKEGTRGKGANYGRETT